MKHPFLKSAVWDFLLVFAASCAQAYTLLVCFYVDSSLHYSFLPAALDGAVLLALFAVSSSRRALRWGAPLVGVALVAMFVVSASFTPGGAYLVDFEQNYLIFTMCVSLCALTCFLLSRTRVGCALLFGAGSLIVSIVQFLYERGELAFALLFVISALALVIFKNYQTALRDATTLKKAKFVPGFAIALSVSCMAVGLGAVAWFGIIAPLDPPAVDVKLITEHRALETLRVKGVADVYQVPNLDMTSDKTNDDERTTDDIKESESGRQVPAHSEVEQQDDDDGANEQTGFSFFGINLDNPYDSFDFISYLQRAWPWVVAIVVLALIAYFAGRRAWRKRRIAKVLKLTPSAQVAVLYPFFMRKFERLGMVQAPGQTLAEYARANTDATELFDRAANVPFTDLTADYIAVAYGKEELGHEASDRLKAYYSVFWKAARRKLGAVKYFFKSFRF